MPALLTSAVDPAELGDGGIHNFRGRVRVADVSVDQRKIRRRPERIGSGNVSRVCNDAITTLQKRLHGPRADPL